ncbi:MAG: biotin/lipoyl-binding protein [Chloroflexi bacterium]|nr:biotin/lipoyl-binding protein [Chloroflexota bacterium]
MKKLLIANRGEIAIRIIRAAEELDLPTVAIYSADDAESLHVSRADEAHALAGRGAAAYLDIEQLLSVAKDAGCDAVHPGYGFLAENAEFARRCAEEGITFVGPSVEALRLLGDKARARELAREHDVPVLPGSAGPVTADEAKAFLRSLGEGAAIVIKAVSGGGGRGMRVVERLEDVEDAHARCLSEALSAFGNADVYVEQLIPRARHIEVQVIGDGSGAVSHLGERECSIQRRHQKLIEIAPSPTLSAELRDAITAAAVRLAEAVSYRSLGTFEFLVDATADAPDNGARAGATRAPKRRAQPATKRGARAVATTGALVGALRQAQGGQNEASAGRSGAPRNWVFIEANPRIQVEHTVTEVVTGVDLVVAQLRLAAGETLAELDLEQAAVPPARGFAIQARVNTERMDPDGSVRPTGGQLAAFDPPSGPGVRVDTYGVPGYTTNPNFDSLLAKVIAHSGSGGFVVASKRLARALDDFRLAGLETNIPFLQQVIAHDDFAAQDVYTRWLDQNLASLTVSRSAPESDRAPQVRAGADINRNDPLASLNFFRSGQPTRQAGQAVEQRVVGPPGTEPVAAPLQATVAQILVSEGDTIRTGQVIIVLSALKMEHEVTAQVGGVVRQLTAAVGDTVAEGRPLAFVEVMEVGAAVEQVAQAVDLDYIRPSLQAVYDRRQLTLDENRPEAIERRHRRGRRTVRENLTQLMDPDSWVEYGQLTVSTPRSGLTAEELIRKTPADGLVAGIGSVNGDLFDEKRARTMFISYDDTVYAGTQGGRGHDKTDRMVELADELSLPLIFHAEGAGARSGSAPPEAAQDAPSGRGHPATRTFERMAQLSGKVPMIGVTAGWCYAGNASILGLTDLIIATEDSLIAMGAPATIEGGGMGIYLPEEIGPTSDTVPAGTVDILVKNQDEAIAASKKVLSYFQGSIEHWEVEDQRLLRHIIPENRHRSFDIRALIRILADKDSVLELRPQFGVSMVTAFVRIEGHPFGLTANNNAYLGGAIDSPGSDKVARFWQLCDAFNIPIITLVDTPGMMVGPEVERTGLVRHCSRLFVTGANLETPRFSVILRKGYALGSIAVMTGSGRAPTFTVTWPEGEFGGMNIEASVLLSNRDALAKIEDIDERAAAYQAAVDRAYERSGAITAASVFGVDDVIDPVETRRWIVKGLQSVPQSEPLRRGRRTFLDTW